MKIDEHNAIITEIAQNLTDQVKVTSLLDKLRTDYGEVSANLETASKNAETNKKAYEEAQKYNMQLFLERTVKQATDTNNQNLDTSEKKLAFEDLDLSNF